MTQASSTTPEGQSRWRSGPASKARGSADRIRLSHAQTRSTMRFVLAFFASAAIAALWADDRWLPLHLFLAGGVVLAISGVSVMLTVTWSAAPAPPNGVVFAQRTCIVVGATGVTAGRTLDWPTSIIGAAGTLYLVGLALLAWLLLSTIRRGVERRFDVAVAAYLSAGVAGLAGVGIGVTMAVHPASLTLRDAHVTANLLGLVGLTIGGSLPFFSATVVRARMAKRATTSRLAVTFGWQFAMVAVAAGALAAENRGLAAAGFFGYALGIATILVWMPPPTKRQFEWAGPRLVALWAGGAWWIVTVVATGLTAADGRAVFRGSWLLTLVVAAFGQIAWGSLAYLLPMLRGGGHKLLGEGFATTKSWPGLAAVNVAGLGFAASWEPVAAVALAVWVIDAAARAIRVGTTRAERPEEKTS